MIENPAVDQTVETRVETLFKYPFKVTCVVSYVDELDRHPAFKIVKQFCQANRVPFSAREYNSTRYDEDCHYISQLPAFHIYSKGELCGTYFTDDNIIQKIQDEIVCYKQEQERKRKRKEAWNNRMNRLVQFFEGLGKKKPKMVVPARPAPTQAAVPIAFE